MRSAAAFNWLAAASRPTAYQPPQAEGGGGVQPNSLIDLAKRALALTVHQLALYRKVDAGAGPVVGAGPVWRLWRCWLAAVPAALVGARA